MNRGITNKLVLSLLVLVSLFLTNISIKAEEAIDPNQIELSDSAIVVKFKKRKYAKEFDLQALLDSIVNPGFDNQNQAIKFVKNKTHRKQIKMVKTFSDSDNTDTNLSNPAISTNTRLSARALRQAARQKKKKKEIGLNRTYTIEVPEGDSADQLLADLKNDPNIEYVEKVITVQTFANFNDPHWDESSRDWPLSYEELWGVRNVQADRAWDFTEGEDVVVAVIDTGVDYNHPDLWDNIWVDPAIINDVNGDGKVDLDDVDTNGNKKIDSNEIVNDMFGYNAVNRNANPMDNHGHGTHCAGTIAAVANNGIGIVGVAPKAKIMSIKGLGDNGSSTDNFLANAVVYAADHGADIINASWGGRGYSALVYDAFDYAKSLGVVNIAAAGNSNQDARNFFPASFESVITVGASTYTDDRASFSNWGSVVDIAAPGGGVPSDATNGSGTNNILSTMTSTQNLARQVSNMRVGNLEDGVYGYYRIAGTSMAAPHVSAVAALVKAARPDLSNSEIEQVLLVTADEISTDRPIGGKRVNALNAVSFDRNPPRAELRIIARETTASGKIKGKIDFAGTARGDGFQKWTLDYSIADANNFTLIAERENPVNNGNLRRDFNTANIADGSYDFRLQVILDDGTVFEDIKTIFINNEGAIKINNCQDLQNIQNSLQDEYILTRDLDCSETREWNNGDGFEPIGSRSAPFKGDLNGNGHVVKGLYMDSSDSNGDGGLFAVLDGAEIRRLGLIDVEFTGTGLVGGIAGYQNNNSFITQSFVTGLVGNGAATPVAGGLVALQRDSRIENSYAQTEVNASFFAGGLVGYQYVNGEIVNTYSTDSASASRVGGLVAYSLNSLVRNSYWDRDSSQIDSSIVASPKSTAEMFTRNTFENWDFDNIWKIQAGRDYPRLRVFKIDLGPSGQNQTPTNIILSNDEIIENSPLETVVGELSTVDPDPDDTHTYKLISVDGDSSSDLFKINSVTNELYLNGPVDYELKTSHVVRIETSDFEGLTFTKDLTINVINLVEDTESDDIL